VTRFAASDAEAHNRFERFHDVDPYPEIDPALLTSADISDYVAATGMIFPFHDDAPHFKRASYQVPLLGQFLYWDEDGQEVSDLMEPNKEFILKQNSIAFVTLEPMFRVPNYIAIRFNLKITNIYRGILLGTGPLVDPGYVGRLSLPLHNLTVNDYKFRGGENLIWMEFTKLSRHNASWGIRRSGVPRREGELFDLPLAKSDPTHDVRYYTEKAYPLPIRSSIPAAVGRTQGDARDAADSAEESRVVAERVRSTVFGFGLAALIVVVLAAVAALVAVFQLIGSDNSRVDSLATQLAGLQAAIHLHPTGQGAGPSVQAAVSQLTEKVAVATQTQHADEGNIIWWLFILTVGAVLLAAVMGWSLWRQSRRSRQPATAKANAATETPTKPAEEDVAKPPAEAPINPPAEAPINPPAEAAAEPPPRAPTA
jgi:deoxycytidine triphosphate deaminase